LGVGGGEARSSSITFAPALRASIAATDPTPPVRDVRFTGTLLLKVRARGAPAAFVAFNARASL
jgi:hypothetical protein